MCAEEKEECAEEKEELEAVEAARLEARCAVTTSEDSDVVGASWWPRPWGRESFSQVLAGISKNPCICSYIGG
eukprot:SAG11_NODE_10202_length_847_cov_1.943850_1_plen_72_part_01